MPKITIKDIQDLEEGRVSRKKMKFIKKLQDKINEKIIQK